MEEHLDFISSLNKLYVNDINLLYWRFLMLTPYVDIGRILIDMRLQPKFSYYDRLICYPRIIRHEL